MGIRRAVEDGTSKANGIGLRRQGVERARSMIVRNARPQEINTSVDFHTFVE